MEKQKLKNITPKLKTPESIDSDANYPKRRGSIFISPPQPTRSISKGSTESLPTPSMEQYEEAQVSLDKGQTGAQSRSVSVSSAPDVAIDKINLKARDTRSDELSLNNQSLEAIRRERTELEEFLFNESNKVNKVAIKYILAKWSLLEGKLQDEILEKEKLQVAYQITQKTACRSYSRIVSAGPLTIGQSDAQPKFAKKNIKEDHEIVLIKPMQDTDQRNNEEIKSAVLNKLEEVKSKLKVRNIRQMRNKGLIIEVKDKKDLNIIGQIGLEQISLRAEKPGKIDPSIIIYDIDKDFKTEEIKESFINKNFENLDDSSLKRLNTVIMTLLSWPDVSSIVPCLEGIIDGKECVSYYKSVFRRRSLRSASR